MRIFSPLERYLHDLGNYFSNREYFTALNDLRRNVGKAVLPFALATLVACSQSDSTPRDTSPRRISSIPEVRCIAWESTHNACVDENGNRVFLFKGDNLSAYPYAREVLFGTPLQLQVYVGRRVAREDPVGIQYSRQGSDARKTFAYVPVGRETTISFNPDELGCYNFHIPSLNFREMQGVDAKDREIHRVGYFTFGRRLNISLKVNRSETTLDRPVTISGRIEPFPDTTILKVHKDLVLVEDIRIDKSEFDILWIPPRLGIYHLSVEANSTSCNYLRTETDLLKVTVR